jgi:hypothetical protein
MGNPKREEPSKLERIPNFLRLEDPKFRRGMYAVLAVIVVGYLILTALVGDFIDPLIAIKGASAVVLFLLGVVIDHVIQLRKESRVEIFPDDYKAEDRQKAIIDESRPQEVKLCEFSGHSQPAQSILRRLINSSDTKSIKLLLHHPEEICSSSNPDCRADYQVNRIIGALEGLSKTTYRDVQDMNRVVLRIKCSKKPASLRGRSFDNKYIALGWYTYDRENQLWGAENSVILAPCNDEDGKNLNDWFNKVFDDLWADAETLEKAVAGYSHSIDPTWLSAVSRPEALEKESQETTNLRRVG